jgi:hypothetical protein
MITIKEFSIFTIIIALISLFTTTIAFLFSVKVYKRKDTKILLLYAGIMFGFIINIIAVLMGLF